MQLCEFISAIHSLSSSDRERWDESMPLERCFLMGLSSAGSNRRQTWTRFPVSAHVLAAPESCCKQEKPGWCGSSHSSEPTELERIALELAGQRK
jgi:hypothetical protein